MSVKVNLLPGDVAARGQAGRTRAIAAAAAGALVLVLAGLMLLQRGQLADAEARLVAVEDLNASLEADIAALQPFADLEQRATSAARIVQAAMGAEVSFAGILQDLSAAMPPTAEFSTLAIAATTDPLAPAPGGERVVYGSLSAAGQVIGVVPGVERLLIDLGRVASFDNVFVPGSATDADGVTTFSVEIELGPEIRTNRYVIDGQEPG